MENRPEPISAKPIVLYDTPDGKVKVKVVYSAENLWLSQSGISELFGVERSVITKHLQNIFTSEELAEKSVCAFFAQTADDGKNYKVKFYNLDAVIAVGYRVNTKQATRFRIWATQTLKEYIVKGFVLNDEMLKNGRPFGKDYFDELLERIREIRASERRFYQKITDIYAQCSYDYDKNAEITKRFYQTVQNKLHFAITGQTAAEIINKRADSSLPNMGLTTWKNAPSGKVLKSDVGIAKNYLIEPEIKELDRIVNMYIDYAENQATRHKLMSMSDWLVRLDAFLHFNEYEILNDAGKISHEVAIATAEEEYEKFRDQQDRTFISDFDIESKRLLGLSPDIPLMKGHKKHEKP